MGSVKTRGTLNRISKTEDKRQAGVKSNLDSGVDKFAQYV